MDLKGDVIFAKSWIVKDYLYMGFSDINNKVRICHEFKYYEKI